MFNFKCRLDDLVLPNFWYKFSLTFSWWRVKLFDLLHSRTTLRYRFSQVGYLLIKVFELFWSFGCFAMVFLLWEIRQVGLNSDRCAINDVSIISKVTSPLHFSEFIYFVAIKSIVFSSSAEGFLLIDVRYGRLLTSAVEYSLIFCINISFNVLYKSVSIISLLSDSTLMFVL